MNDFKPFWFLIFIPLSVILFYFSFKTIILFTVLVVAVLYGANNLSIIYDEPTFSKFQKRKGQEKKPKTKVNKESKQREPSKKVYFNEQRGTEMPASTVKLTPGPSFRKPNVTNQSFSSTSSYLRTSINSSSSFLDRSDSQLAFTPKHLSLNSQTPFLPTIKRALGLSEYSPRQEESSFTPSYISQPSYTSPGFIPAVRLIKRERTHISQQKTAARSPNVVRIAPPEPHKLSSPRLFHIQTTSNTDQRRTPDTQAVISALKEKSLKRSYGGFDHDTSYADYPIQQAKRRRQDSQQSNSSTSSLPPLPDSLPDLSSTGYTIPRLETPTLKRSALINDWDDSCSAKKLRKDGRINSISSSLSSSQRIAEKEKIVKRKVSTSDNKENNELKSKQKKLDGSNSFSLNRSDTVLIPPEPDIDTSVAKAADVSVNKSTLDSAETPEKPKLDKKITLNQSFSARKREMSLYSGLNKSFQKVPHANVIASMEDYENDMGAEKKRVQEMLEGIQQAELEKEKEKEKKEAEEKAKAALMSAPTVVITSTSVSSLGITSAISTPAAVPSITTGVSLMTEETATSTSAINPVSLAKTAAASPLTFNFATVKSSSPSKTTTQVGFLLSSSITSSAGSTIAGSNTTTVTSSGFALSTGFSASSQPTALLTTGISSGAMASAPNFSFGISTSKASTGAAGATGSSGFSFGSNPPSSAPSIGLVFGNTTSTSTSVTSAATPSFNFGTGLAPTTTTRSSTPSGFNFGVAATTATTGFGSQPQSSTPFGAPQSNSILGGQPSVNNAFGQTTTTTTNTGFSTGTNTAASTLNFKTFGSASVPPAQPQASIFGNPSSNTAAFGTVASTAAQSTVIAPTTSSAASTGFNFGGTSSSFSFGNQGNQGSASFGLSTSTPGSSFGTGLSTQPKAGFGFATSNTFGSQTTTGSTFGTGSGMFGAPSTTKTNSFGTGLSTFGADSTTLSSGFGTFGQTTSTFGVPKTAAGPTFGQGSTPFGTAATTQNTGFGTSFGQPTSTFGAPKATTGQSFGTSGLTFGHGSAAFGASTTQSSSSGSFSFSGSTTAQKSGTTFNFGGAPSAAPSTPNNKGGFDFSAASTPASSGGFNFSANASFATPTGPPTPVFGTPTGGTPNVFNVQNPGGIPKPRVAQRGTRRTVRRR